MKPKLHPNGKGYITNFSHPLLRKVVTRGLGTSDENLARAICNEAELLFSNADILQHPTKEKLLGFQKRAVELVFGDERAAQILGDSKPGALTEQDRFAIAAIVREADKAADTIELPADRETMGPLPLDVVRKIIDKAAARPALIDLEVFERLKGFSPRNQTELYQTALAQARELNVLRPRIEYLEAELARAQRTANADVKISINDAVAKFLPVYKLHRNEKTYKRGESWLNHFVEWAKSKKRLERLGLVKTSDIDEWTEQLTGTKVDALAAPTKYKARSYLSVFFKWAKKRFNLVANPMAEVDAIPGAQTPPEHIVAIRRPEEITALLDALKPHAYWRAWVATAILAGPRWSEQRWLKVTDVYLEDGYLRVTTRTSGRRRMGTTKTGRERNVPIEKTTLAEILKEHVELRKAEQKKANATEAERSEFLFPTTVPPGQIVRTKTPAGLWSDNRVWQDAWQGSDDVLDEKGNKEKTGKEGVVEKASAAAGTIGEAYWSYGPDEWRHCFGTALGHCGWSAMEICRVMGNTEKAARDHYIAGASAGKEKRWKFVW